MFSAAIKTGAAAGYRISRSLRFNAPDSTHLTRTFSSAGNRRTWTWSAWVKQSEVDGFRNMFTSNIFTAATDSMSIRLYLNVFKLDIFNSGSGIATIQTDALIRDYSAWYHFVCAVDTTQATASNRVKLYINGVQQTVTGTYPAQNYEYPIGSTSWANAIGAWNTGAFGMNGYMTEMYFIDGQALTPSSFGETNAQTGVWQPKAYAGSYGTNGFYLNFSDNSNTTAATLGKDYSGNGNNWTPNNFSVAAGAGNDSLVDSPTAYGTDTGAGGTVRGNYCTLNPLDSAITLSNGNLDYASDGSGITKATMGMSSGKWYWECVWRGTTGGSLFGIASESAPPSTAYLGQTAATWSYYINGTKYNNGSNSSYGASYTTNDVIGVALDMDAGTLVFYKNGVSQGTAASGLTGVYFPAAGNNDVNDFGTFNFGQRAFAYTAPSGFKALCTQNLPTPTIGATTATQAGKYFNAVLYTGTQVTRSITGVGFQPDFVWIKNRSIAINHGVYDAVRGVLKDLQTNVTDAEVNLSGSLTSFDSDGFSLGTAQDPNKANDAYVAWNWKANGAGSTNTAGSITSTVSANTTSGFSVVTFTGTGSQATVGHGLGAAPALIIGKKRSAAANWFVYHASVGASAFLYLNTTDASISSTGAWGGVTPTSTVFTAGAGFNDANGATYVAYCFAEVPGFSRFGSYTGNGSTDGPFVFCGFRPRYVLIKSTAGVRGWGIFDTARGTFNVNSLLLEANSSGAEINSASYQLDILSNGFKIRTDNQYLNFSGDGYIFAAFAESPFKYALAR